MIIFGAVEIEFCRPENRSINDNNHFDFGINRGGTDEMVQDFVAIPEPAFYDRFAEFVRPRSASLPD